MSQNNNIILIGFMGVGKGSTARAFHKQYGTYIIDTDDLIESQQNKEIKKIFAKKGERYFRALEQETADWIADSVRDTMISCGGGFYQVNNLSKLGTVVLLDASFDWILNRLKSAKNSKAKFAKRPLFLEPSRAQELYNQRAKAYRAVADIIINVENKSRKEICKEIATKTMLV